MYLKLFLIFLKGSAMGLADLIPGISGGTIALILGIYKKFINSLKSINLQSIKLLFTFNFKELNKQLNLVFLIPLFSGIIFSVLVFLAQASLLSVFLCALSDLRGELLILTSIPFYSSSSVYFRVLPWWSLISIFLIV